MDARAEQALAAALADAPTLTPMQVARLRRIITDGPPQTPPDGPSTDDTVDP